MEWGLIGPREADRLWERHVLNSVALADLLPPGALVVDVGSGAGLPGIPLAILRPDLVVTLLEAAQRRASFLELAVAEIGLGDRVRVVRTRAEEHVGRYDVVTSRALAPLDRMLAWCGHLCFDGFGRVAAGPEGEFIVLKGASAAAEVEAAAAALARAGLTATIVPVRAHPEAEATTAVVVRRA